jgi:sec-independent protein translocase protein TatA
MLLVPARWLTETTVGGNLRTMLAIAGLGMGELLVVLAIAFLIFGARRLPEIGSGLGNAIKNFRAGLSGKDEIDVTPKKDELPDGKK